MELLGSVVLEERGSALDFGYDEELQKFSCKKKLRLLDTAKQLCVRHYMRIP